MNLLYMYLEFIDADKLFATILANNVVLILLWHTV